jgi:hypothetical protein
MSRFACGSIVVAAVLSIGSVATLGCSSTASGSKPTASGGSGTEPEGTTGGSTPSTGSGSSTGSATSEGPQAVTETGTIVDLESKKPISGATVTAGDQTATTATDGTFSLTLQKGDPFQLSVTASGYATLLEQQTSLSADYSVGSTTIVPNETATLLTAMLSGYDSTLGVLSVAVTPTGACASEDGATITVSPAGSAKVTYFSGGIPSSGLTAVKGGQFPSAVIYNVATGVPLTVTVSHPTCSQAPFPFTQGGVVYTGGISTESGEVTGFAKIFLQ